MFRIHSIKAQDGNDLQMVLIKELVPIQIKNKIPALILRLIQDKRSFWNMLIVMHIPF